MLPELHGILQRLLYERGGIAPDDVDIRFEAPTREWVDRLTRPTINLFLLHVEENMKLSQNGFETTKANGRAERRQLPKRIDLQYIISALASEIDDEHALLWRVLGTLMAHPTIPTELLPSELRAFDLSIPTRIAQPDDRLNVVEVWSSLGLEPHSALSYIVTMPLDVNVPATYSPLVLTRTIRIQNTRDAETEAGWRVGIAGVVRNKRGEPIPNVTVSIDGGANQSLSDEEGRFRLPRARPGNVTLRAERDGHSRTTEVQVPSESYDIVFDEAVADDPVRK